jgi:amino acid adenylation domain-containing protein
LVVCPPELLGDPAALLGFLRRRRVESADFVPAVLRLVMDHLEAAGERLDFLRFLIVGSDAWRVDEYERARGLCGPDVHLLNAYGVTEATIDTTFLEAAGRPSGFGAVPIGRPFAGSRVHVVDRHGAPVPIGVAGELVIGGRGVARGYQGRPALTAERFVPDGLAGKPGDRLYRTGDLARWLPDGNLQFLGRTDHQIKIRGFRIEPGEVEAALVRLEGVREAVAMAREDVFGDRRLVAYVVPAAGAELASADLRRALAAELPEPMVPAAIVVLPELPLTPNGKVDLKALPAPRDLAATVFAAPEGELEEKVAAVWCAVLGRSRVGRDEGFFDLGGHSLLAAQVVSRLRTAAGIDLPVRALFEAPTVARLAERIAGLTESLRPGGAEPLLQGVRIDENAPLSFAQSRLWFLDQLTPGLAVYNVPAPLRLTGPLQPAALAQALSALAQRHEPLRTTFAVEEGEPRQVIHPAAPVPLPVVDLAGLGEEGSAAEAGRLLDADSRRPFDLAAGPLLRAALLRWNDREHWLLLTFHHIVADGWSMGIVMRELAALYAALAAGTAPSLAALPTRYADFAVWQRQLLSGERLAGEIEHWREQLAGAPTALALPTDHPRPAEQTFAGADLDRDLPPDLAAGLRALCRRETTTLFIATLAALDALLYRYTRQEDFLVGCAVAGRGREELEGLVGLFVNTLVLRADMSGNPPFRELLRRAQETTLTAQAHQDLPFEILVEELKPARDLSRSPFFQVLVNQQPAPEPLSLAPGLTAVPLSLAASAAKLDLHLAVVDAGEGLSLELEYATDLFEKPTMIRFLDHFERLLAAAVERPDRTLLDLPLLSAAEEAQLAVEWNDTAPPPAPPAGLHDLFAVQAARTPEATAVIGPDGGRLTYRELAERAGELARRLRGQGVGPEVLVGVMMDRTPDLIAALLGVLVAGGAYVPIDPAYPAQRVAFLLENSGAAVLIDQGDLTPLTPLSHRSPFPRERGENAHLAYVIYTSGSTGTPKGVAIEHRSAVAMVRWALSVFPAEERAAVLAATSICFDLSVFEIFVPLLSGGTVVLAENAPALPSHPAAGEVTLVNTVPSAMAELVRSGGLPGSVRTVNLAGEPLLGALARAIHAALPSARLYNLYGPSEDTTYSTFALIPRGAETPSIGRPIAGSQAYILDATLRPVPVGVPGEIHLGGDGLARGYLGRPELTAERFLPDPYGVPGARLYRTGDLARFRPDGEMEFLGRLDHQVKVRGFRIELGEIEAALAGLAAVRESAVLALPEPGGDGQRLVAFVVPAAGREERRLAADLRAALGAQLPQPLVPTSFVILPALPLTPNGKLDRPALAQLAAQAEAARLGVGGAPRTPVEAALAGIWSEIFQRPVAIGDSFFELGGHSLLAVRMVSRIRGVLGIELPVRRVFAAPTVAELAAHIEAVQPGAADLVPFAVLAAGRGGVLPLSFAQSRLWFLDQLAPGSPVYNIPAPLRLSGPLEPAALARALSAVVQRHSALRTTFALVEGEPRQILAPPHPVPLPLVDLTGLAAGRRDTEAGRLLAAEARRSFDLAAGPLLFATLLRLAADEHHLLLNVHHIVTDGWSMGILTRELAAFYSAPPPAELPVQYADFAVWQRRWLAGATLEAQMGYWRRELAGAPTAIDLPTDHPRPASPTYRGAALALRLAPETVAALRRFCRRETTTLFVLCLAALDTLLLRYSRQEDLLVGCAVAGRNREEIEGTIGFFVNTLVLRADLRGNPPFRDLLRRAQATALAAFEHQDLPFEMLVEELKPERDLSRSPFFQVLINLQTGLDPIRLGAGLAVEPLGTASSTAKLDLHLSIADAGETVNLELEYATDLFEQPTMLRLLDHLARLLAAAVEQPELALADLPLLSPAEEAQVLVAWNDTAASFSAPAGLHHLFAAQAARTPEATALIGPDGGRLTYRELAARSGALARHLRGLGVGPETLVGVMMDRTAELIVALLAVLEAGGAYVPIDPAYPPQRVAFLLENSRAAVLITRRALAAGFAASLPAAELLFIEEANLGWAEGSSPLGGGGLEQGGGQEGGVASRRNLPAFRSLPKGGAPLLTSPLSQPPPSQGGGTMRRSPKLAPMGVGGEAHLAYIIYTSGSTGTPKGVAIEHRSAVAMVRWALTIFPPEELAGVLAATSVCFDLSVFEIFVPLLSGGAVVLAENALALPSHPAAGEVTLVNTVPSAMAELVRSGGLPSSVRTVNLAGEALKGTLVRAIYERTPAERVYNLYGPSEDTTYSTFALIPRGAETPAIGRPVAGSQAYILDGELRPVPIGVPGAVYLAGAGLARGYLGRPELTAERFLPDPYGRDGGRLYRTGDLARFRADGEMEYLGRIDQQVKVRGFRIELGEIEAALARQGSVRESAVLALPEPDGEGQRLVAFVVPAGGQTGDRDLAASLRAALGESLPKPLVPASFVFLPALPLTPNGKLDRRALENAAPAAETAGPSAGGAPRTPVEEVLAGIWAEVFGRAAGSLGVEDNFFDLGGHSLLAVRAVSRIRAALGVDLPLTRLFAAPTVAGLAAAVEAEIVARRGVPLPAILPSPREGELPLSFSQQRLWLLDQVDPGQSVFNLPFPLRLRGPLDSAALERALAEIVRRHEALRTVFQARAGHGVQVVRPAAGFTLPVVDLTGLAPDDREREARRLADRDADLPFELARGPLLRTALLRLAAEDHVLLTTMHHIVSDAWSLTVLVRELQILHAAFAAGRPSPLPEPALQYPDFAVWQRSALDGGALGALLDRFKERFGTDLPTLRLPTDKPRPAIQTSPGAVASAVLPQDVADGVRRLAQRSGATLFMALLAAFQGLLARLTGQERIVVGTPVAGRNRAELEGLIGFFVNTVVLPADTAGDPTFAELLGRVRDMALTAYACQDLPFEKLVEALQPKRDPSRSPLFQVMFALHSEDAPPRREDGFLAVDPFPVDTSVSQFDLTLYMSDMPDGLAATIEYNTDLFTAPTVERMLSYYQAFLAAAVAAPETRLSALPPAAEELSRPPAEPVPVLPAEPAAAATATEARRDRLAARMSKLTAEQRQAMERRLRGEA